MGERFGHHHLLVDRDSIMEGVLITSDVNHFHFGNCETIELDPGSYLLTLQFTDGKHRSFGEKMSAFMEIIVK